MSWQKIRRKSAVTHALLAMALILPAVNLPAQEGRKVISGPIPRYPELARNLRLTGVVKVQIIISPEGKITSTKILGGHPLFVASVEDTLKNWKYAPAAAETTAVLEFRFNP